MSWIKGLWNKLVSKTSVTPTVVVVEEISVADIFCDAIVQSGVDIDYVKENLLGRFCDWYDGAPTEESVINSIDDFIQTLPTAVARNVLRQQSK